MIGEGHCEPIKQPLFWLKKAMTMLIKEMVHGLPPCAAIGRTDSISADCKCLRSNRLLLLPCLGKQDDVIPTHVCLSQRSVGPSNGD